MTDEKTTERRTIKVASVSPPRKVGDKYEVVEFKGEDGVTYEVWSSTLAEAVKVGAELDVEIIHTTKVTDQATYHHHKVTQIYIDGQPVRGKKDGGYRGHSPEERRSIERQVSAKLACEFFDTKTGVDPILLIAEKIYQWISKPTDTSKSTDKPALKPSKPESKQTIPPTGGKVEETLQFIADQMKFKNTSTARKWLEQSMKIDRIDSDPEGVLREVADLQGWNL